MKGAHGPATLRGGIHGNGTAVGLMDALAASGLNCELFRSARVPGVNVAVDSVCELCSLTASEAIRRIAGGELRAEEYVARLLQRHRALRSLNAITWIDEARVLESARAVDQRRVRGERLGALGGLPVLINDNIDVAGTPTTAATSRFRDNVPARTAFVVQRLLDQGAIVFGKANMHELAGGATSNNPLTGAVGNPYDPGRIAGGSSGGTAAAIAARIVPAGLGSDTAGSVRIPSALCGTAGLRPSTAGGKLYGDSGVIPLARDLDTVGPMARTAKDTALMHSAITGRPPAAVPDLRTVRIGVPRIPYWEDIDEEVARVAEDALVRLRAAGVTLIEVDPRGYHSLACEVFQTLVMHGIQADIRLYLGLIGSAVTVEEIVEGIKSRDTKALFERARTMKFTAAQIGAARWELRRSIGETYRELLRSNGLAAIVFPTEPTVAAPINAHGDGPADTIEINGRRVDAVALIRNTLVTCALGAPGLSMPAGLTRRGMPVGLELDAAPGRDSELLALAMAVEQVWPRLPAPRVLHGMR